MDHEDRRRFIRIPKRVEFAYTTELTLIAEIADLGEAGAFVVTPDPLPAGTGLQYKFYLPDDLKPIEGQARVVRQEQTVGMAVEFQGLSQEDHERIRRLVASEALKRTPGS